MNVDTSKLSLPTRVQHLRCILHNIQFSMEVNDVNEHLNTCPLCRDAEFFSLRQELEKVKYHRDALLRAIEVKETVIPACA